MIIVDLNQVMISNLMVQLGNHQNAKVEESMVRHMVLNSLRSYKSKFGAEFGELVIACDNTNLWRKKIFPHYKANRKKNIEESEIDWKSIFEAMNHIRQDLKDFFPYRIIDVPTAEADDVIGALVETFNNKEKILIMSGDKDFVQLHKFKNVSQYDPVRKKYIKHDDPKRFLLEHILKGDSGDGIPNVLSVDNCFVSGIRQRPITQKRMDELSKKEFERDSEVGRNFMRNEMLIDLSLTPKKICDEVVDQYEGQSHRDRSKLMNYFITHKLKMLTEHLAEF